MGSSSPPRVQRGHSPVSTSTGACETREDPEKPPVHPSPRPRTGVVFGCPACGDLLGVGRNMPSRFHLRHPRGICFQVATSPSCPLHVTALRMVSGQRGRSRPEVHQLLPCLPHTRPAASPSRPPPPGPAHRSPWTPGRTGPLSVSLWSLLHPPVPCVSIPVRRQAHSGRTVNGQRPSPFCSFCSSSSHFLTLQKIPKAGVGVSGRPIPLGPRGTSVPVIAENGSVRTATGSRCPGPVLILALWERFGAIAAAPHGPWKPRLT